jgi:hypothetical protein
VHFREVQDHDASVFLGRNGVSQFESSVIADKSACALNDCHLTSVVDTSLGIIPPT